LTTSGRYTAKIKKPRLSRDRECPAGQVGFLNANRANPLASAVVYSKSVEDITDKLLASLHKRTAAK